MRKAAITALVLILVAGCGESQQGESEKGFIAKPGELTKFDLSAQKSFSINIDSESCGPSNSCHAVIYSGTASGNYYVGILISDDPKANNSFYLSIYFVSSVIPASISLSSGNPDHMMTLRKNGLTSFTPWSAGNPTLAFTDEGDGTYTINMTGGSATFGADNLASLTIRAQKYPQ
jgi:hypothetical protein